MKKILPTLILLAPYKFTKYHYNHYELDFFENKIDKNFEIHDLSLILNPQSEFIFKNKRHKRVKVFLSVKEWLNYFNKINNEPDKLVVFNLLDISSFNSILIHFILKKNKNKIIQLKSPGIPNIHNESKKVKIDLSKKKLKFLQTKYLFYSLKNKLFKFLIKFILFDEIYYLVRGNKINFKIELNSRKKKFIKYHSHDFSRLKLINKYKKKESIGVFLDAPDPYFEDDFSLFGLKFNYDKLTWYNNLNKFLNDVEKVYSTKIIIIPHPKVKGFRNPYYNKNFKVNHDIDAIYKLIPKSKVVISMSASTAISVAIACGKRLILTYNNQIIKANNSLYNSTRFVGRKCDANLINIDSYDKKKIIKKVNKDKYNNYLYNYITSKKILKKKNYEILNEILKDLKK
tara:strand:- start:58 stop:1260 length:1203 start_codon:yes stop_codon:yes gene_type:complete